MHKLSLLAIFLLVRIVSIGQENYEIQVYGSQTQQKNSTIFELHSNYTFNGERNAIKGVRPSYHSLHETIEITHGLGNNFELGAYLFMNYTPHYGYQIVGTHIRPRVMAPARWKWPLGVSLSAEIGYQRKDYSGETWNIEVRPIADKQWDKLYVSFNPTFGIALKSADNNSIPVFEPNLKTSFAFFPKFALGLEYYGSLGAINSFETFKGQSHGVFAAIDLINNTTWELNAGAGFGLTPATDAFICKVIVGRRVFWKKKE